MKNIRFKGGEPLQNDKVKQVISAAESRLGEQGRLVIRQSGTEPVIRVMGEGDNADLVCRIVDEIIDALRTAA